MSHALLISDNQTLNCLYAVNLNAYVATNVTVKTDYKAAKELLELSLDFDVVICLDNTKYREELLEILKYLKEATPTLPVILVGSKTDVTEANFIAIPNQYSIKEILRSVAKILQISAKDMATKEVPEYFPIPVPIISVMEQTKCDIYHRIEVGAFEYEYFKIINKGQEIDPSVNKLKKEGTDFLYVESTERLNFINETSGYILKELSNGNLSSLDKVKVLGHGFDIVGNQLFENPEAAEEIQEISYACINSISEVIEEIPNLTKLLTTLLNSKGEYVYIHSILSSYIASHIIENMKWGSKEQKEKLSFVLFFHDIFLVPIYKRYPHLDNEESLLFCDDLNDNEKSVVLEHARLAGELVRNFKKIPLGVDIIITQHHGMSSGKGFAMQFRDDISPLSKVVMIAEEMAYHLYKLQKNQQSFKDNKEDIIQELKDKFRMHTYQKIIKTLYSIEV
jgi:HD-GYP domain-containing protein (c-di-GMP phosphodiesterase class II)